MDMVAKGFVMGLPFLVPAASPDHPVRRRLRAWLPAAFAVLLLAGLPPLAAPGWAAAGAPAQAAPKTAPDLRDLVARIALYPDDLLSLVLPASAAPLDVVQAVRYLDKRGKDPSPAPDPNWDPAVIALLNYPEALRLMDSDLDWAEQLGQAVAGNLNGVLDAIQGIRNEAVGAGYLASNDKVTVTRQPAPAGTSPGAAAGKQTVVIRSADPDIVYVPTYSPAMVVNQTYASAPPVAYPTPYLSYQSPAAPFFTGLLFGTALGYALSWDDRDIDIDVHHVDWDDIDWDHVDWDKVHRVRPDIDIGGDVNVNVNTLINNGRFKNVDRTTLQSQIDANRQTFVAAHGQIGDGQRRVWRPDDARPEGGRPRQDGPSLDTTQRATTEGLRQRDQATAGAPRLQQPRQPPRVGDGTGRKDGAFGNVAPRPETGRASVRGRESLDLPQRPGSRAVPQDRPGPRQRVIAPAALPQRGSGRLGDAPDGNRNRLFGR
ncbi:DUF3300 domain-containing protein [Inquilinus sp. CA228]|uniref:DUF3300 domain-containing protein n=1 Tax=Inquilinus sp. CA228 TaxID=3455609 RepID=UPI003F8D395E